MEEPTFRPNEARPAFRIAAGIIALGGWPVAVLAAAISHWQVCVASALLALSCSWVAIAGYMPRMLVRLFSRGPVPNEDRMR